MPLRNINFKRFSQLSAILVAAMLLQGCFMHKGFTDDRLAAYSPRTLVLRGLPDEDTPYAQGFRNGCNTGLGIIGEGFNRFKGFSYNAEKAINDAAYAEGYTRGFNYCTYYTDTDPL